MNKSRTKQMGFWMALALVIGNMIGSGIFFLPAALGSYGGISTIGWFFTSAGALLLAWMFSKLSQYISTTSGGPYVYTREGFGDFAAFLVAWGYILSVWASNAAIAVAFISYLSVFIPILATNAIAAVFAGLTAIWFLTWLNSREIRSAGTFQLITTILKITPLVLVAIVGLFYIDMDHFVPFNSSGQSDWSAITSTAALTLFAYLGFESATIPSEKIENPETTVPRATMIGTLITVVVYILGTVSVMGLISPAELQYSNAPFADAAALMWGETGRYLVAGGVVISTFGALNGWMVLQGQIPFAAARDNLFLPIFSRENKHGSPSIGIIIGSVIISVFILMNFSRGMVGAYEFLVLVTTTTILVPYLFSAGAYGMFVLQGKFGVKKNVAISMIVPTLGFAYALWAVAGSGQEAVFWGFILLMGGIPFYIFLRSRIDKDLKD